jgi:hypothetical protein
VSEEGKKGSSSRPCASCIGSENRGDGKMAVRIGGENDNGRCLNTGRVVCAGQSENGR